MEGPKIIALLMIVLAGVLVVVYVLIEQQSRDAKEAARREQCKAEEAARALADMARRNLREAEEEASRCRSEEAARRYRETQEMYRLQMVVLTDEALRLFESIPQHVRTADAYLDQSEADFNDRAFAPFWDSVERAVQTLVRFDESVRKIDGILSSHAGLVKQYEAEAPSFPLAPQSVKRLLVGSASAERMRGIVRKAQSDFQFAVIYEQRKTNQILASGFTTLAQALEQMTWRIQASIGTLASAVDAASSSVTWRMDDMATATA